VADSGKGFLSEVEIEDLRLISASMDVTIDAPEPGMQAQVAVTVSVNDARTSRNDEIGRHRIEMAFALSAIMSDASPEAVERMRASATMWVVATCATNGRDDDEAGKLLFREAAAVGYSNAGAQILQLTRMSPMGGYVVPPIDPEALMEVVKVSEDGARSI